MSNTQVYSFQSEFRENRRLGILAMALLLFCEGLPRKTRKEKLQSRNGELEWASQRIWMLCLFI